MCHSSTSQSLACSGFIPLRTRSSSVQDLLSIPKCRLKTKSGSCPPSIFPPIPVNTFISHTADLNLIYVGLWVFKKQGKSLGSWSERRKKWEFGMSMKIFLCNPCSVWWPLISFLHVSGSASPPHFHLSIISRYLGCIPGAGAGLFCRGARSHTCTASTAVLEKSVEILSGKLTAKHLI